MSVLSDEFVLSNIFYKLLGLIKITFMFGSFNLVYLYIFNVLQTILGRFW